MQQQAASSDMCLQINNLKQQHSGFERTIMELKNENAELKAQSNKSHRPSMGYYLEDSNKEDAKEVEKLKEELVAKDLQIQELSAKKYGIR